MNIGKKFYKANHANFDERKSHVAWTVPDPAGDPYAAGNDHPAIVKIASDYTQAWEQFRVAGAEKSEGWTARARIDLDRTETPSFSRRKNRYLAVTALALTVGLFGFYPTKIPFVDISVTKEQWWIITLALLVSEVFAFISYCVEQREYLVRATLVEVEQKARGVYQAFDNRVTAYVRAQEAERRAYYKQLPSWVTSISCALLLGRLTWPVAHSLFVGGAEVIRRLTSIH